MPVPAAAPLDSRDHARFQAVFEAELSYVWASLVRLGVPTRDVEDLCHELFLEVFRRFASYDPARPIRPWLFAFAFRFASDYRRLARHRVEVMDPTFDAPAPGALADSEMEQQERAHLVHSALQAIEVDRRAVFVLHELDGCTMQEATDVLGIPLHTGYSRLRVAREEFTAAVRRLRLARGREGGAP